MAFSDYSTTPSLNTSIAGTNVAEGCAAGNVNNAIRQLMADGKTLNNTVSAITTGMPYAGGTFTGAIFFNGAGAYRYNTDPTLISGRDYHLIEGSSRPSSPAEGDRVFYYSA